MLRTALLLLTPSTLYGMIEVTTRLPYRRFEGRTNNCCHLRRCADSSALYGGAALWHSQRRLSTTTSTPAMTAQPPPATSSTHSTGTPVKGERSYVYFLNQRGQLFHIFDVEGFASRDVTPSGPTFLRDPKFLDFFFSRLVSNWHFIFDYAQTRRGPTATVRGDCDAAFGGGPSTHTSPASLRQLLLAQSSDPSALWELFNRRPVDTQQQQLTTSANDGDVGGTTRRLLSDEDIVAALRHRFPWVSRCGHEQNYIVAEDSPIVFHDLQWTASSSSSPSSSDGDDRENQNNGDDVSYVAVTKEAMLASSLASTTHPSSQEPMLLRHQQAELLFAGTLREPFLPSSLRCSRDGRLYHPVTASTHFIFRREWGSPRAFPRPATSGAAMETSDDADATSLEPPLPPLLGLVGAQVGLRLGLDFVCEDQTAEGNFEIEWLGATHVIPFLDDP
jgi:hypothetical protein